VTVGQAQSPGQELLPSFVSVGLRGGLAAAAGAVPAAFAGGEEAAAPGEGGDAAVVASGVAGGATTAAMVPPKIVTRPIASSASMPVATTELVLTDTRGSIQSRR